ncbi:MAG: YdeI/OmpD-associated family protein [Ferruginibacter sp.]|nr:YdeI/OmpD-associated family protein [Ferruginibacter sp.]
MKQNKKQKFNAIIHIIGINPFVFVPTKVLEICFKQAGRDKGPIPIKGSINGKDYKQTLVRYSNEWRLYINTMMLKDSPKRIGEKIEVTIAVDTESREIEMPPAFAKALKANKAATLAFEQQTASRKKEIVRYLANLKTKESLERNIVKAIGFLTGREKFVGREKNKPATEKAVPPQAWHVTQQKKGKVKPTTVNSAEKLVNDNDALEKEAGVMGESASMPVRKPINKK